jgi:quercetin dioxygenase-like cupin family protein
MKRIILISLLALSFGLVWADDKKADHKDGHVIVTPDKLQWKPHPALPAGAMAAVLSGDPTKAGSVFAVRVKLPDGYKVPPHWHPSDENVTVIQGTLLIATGDKFDMTKLESVPAGSFMHMPKEMRHFAATKGETILQVHGVGPFEVNYVNPADDPRKK